MSASNYSLFDGTDEIIDFVPADDRLTVVSGDIAAVRGLSFYPNFVTSGEERVLLWQADRDGEWSTHWSRRTKSYGVRYFRGGVSEEHSQPAIALPSWADFVCNRLVEKQVLSRLPNQMGINEYMPGQGIAQHVDYFGGSVVSLSLGSGCVMDFTVEGDQSKKVSLWLPRCSVVVLQGEARNVWQHGIKGRLKDVVDGRVVTRDRRISLTFRDVQQVSGI